MTYQQNIIIEYIQDIIEQHLLELPEEQTIEEMVLNNINKLNYGDYIAIDVLQEQVISISKLDGFNQTFNINKEAIVINYEQLERLFNEQTIF